MPVTKHVKRAFGPSLFTVFAHRNRIPRQQVTNMPKLQSSNSKEAVGSAPRLFTDVLLPIKSRFVDLIVSGAKNHEYRNYQLRSTVERLWLYETAPACKIRYDFPLHVRNAVQPSLNARQIYHSDCCTKTARAGQGYIRCWK